MVDSKFYVGVDVGISTGLAVLNEDGSVYYHTVVTKETVDSPAFRVIAQHGNLSSHICIEYPEPDIKSRTPELMAVIEAFMLLFPFAFRVRPGTWKNSAIAAQPLPDGITTKLTPHERDAINIARWYREYLQHA